MNPFGGFGTTPSRKLPPSLLYGHYSRQRLLFFFSDSAVIDWLSSIGLAFLKHVLIDVLAAFGAASTPAFGSQPFGAPASTPFGAQVECRLVIFSSTSARVEHPDHD